MSTFFPGGIFAVSSLTSPTMVMREERLRAAKQHSDRSQRELTRDRQNLERKEKALLAECKRLAQKGDLNGARMVANQVARYRRLHDRNLESSILIGTKTQAMVSDHKVNRAEVETIKGFTYANMYESFSRAEAREQRYAWRMSAVNHLESSMRETMDEVYRGEADADDRDTDDGPTGSQEQAQLAQMSELELQSIMQQAMGGVKSRVYSNHSAATGGPPTAPFIIHLRLLDSVRGAGASLTLNPITNSGAQFAPTFTTNTTTIDAVKRTIVNDRYVCGQLELTYGNGAAVKHFQVGRINADTAEFVPFEFSDTLKSAGVQCGDTVWVRATEPTASMAGSRADLSTSGVDNDIEERLQRMRVDLRQPRA